MTGIRPEEQITAIAAVVMTGIGFASFCSSIWYAYEQKSLIYWKLILALVLMTTAYILQLVWLAHSREGHQHYDHNDKSQAFISNAFVFTWPFTVLPTVLYTWQNFEMVLQAVDTNKPRTWHFKLRAMWVLGVSVGVAASALTFDYFLGECLFYLDLKGNRENVDLRLGMRYLDLTRKTCILLVCFMGLGCLTSCGFLAGTIYWAN